MTLSWPLRGTWRAVIEALEWPLIDTAVSRPHATVERSTRARCTAVPRLSWPSWSSTRSSHAPEIVRNHRSFMAVRRPRSWPFAGPFVVPGGPWSRPYSIPATYRREHSAGRGRGPPIACCSTSADGKPWLSNWASCARDLGYDYTTVASPSGGWWLLGVGPRHYPTADRLAHDRPVLLLRQFVAQRAADQLNGIEAKVPRDFVERIESQIPLAPLDARNVPRGESDAMGERLLGEAPVPSLTPEIRA